MASDGPSSHGLLGGAGGFAAGDGRCPGFAFFVFGSGAGFAACRGAGAVAGVAGAAAAGWDGSHGCGADPFGAVARPPGAMTAWMRSSAERRNSRARKLVGSSR